MGLKKYRHKAGASNAGIRSQPLGKSQSGGSSFISIVYLVLVNKFSVRFLMRKRGGGSSRERLKMLILVSKFSGFSAKPDKGGSP